MTIQLHQPPDFGFFCLFFFQVNTVIFVLSAKVSCQRKRHYYERKRVVSLLRTAFLLLLLIGATWLLGLLAVNSDVLTFHYLFAIFSCLQVGGCRGHSEGPLLGHPW